MQLHGKTIRLSQLFCLALYYGFAQYLPASYTLGGKVGKRIRYMLCKHIFKKCGKNVNVERRANFGAGTEIEIGDNSGLGVNCMIPNGTVIGNDVMMGENCFIIRHNHIHSHTDTPMNKQGFEPVKTVIIEDDVWIGRNVTIMPGLRIKKGTIIGTCCVLTKNFDEYSIVGGVPGKFLKSRVNDEDNSIT